MHNALFDCAMVKNNYGVDLMPAVHTDTMVLAHLLDENRRVGLKDLGVKFYGDEAKLEQEEMKASVTANGGVLTKACYELYKGDPELIAKYGAKDAILTYNLFFDFVEELHREGLDKFFYEEETMPLLRGPSYALNTTGLKVDMPGLEKLRQTLEVEIFEAHAFVMKEIASLVTDYPGTLGKEGFNVGSGTQLAWLLFEKMQVPFTKLSDSGGELCQYFNTRRPYTNSARQEFKNLVGASVGQVWKGKTKVKPYWAYASTDSSVLNKLAPKYKWVAALQSYKKKTKLLSTYVEGILTGAHYGVIHPSFLQHGTQSGRYSSRSPNFQNLPRDDKRIKDCIVARPGRVFVGADFEQIEPRIFASLSGDERLINCFKTGEDFYSVIGMEVFGKRDAVALKEGHPDAFGTKYKNLRQISKTIALATTYGATAPRIAAIIGVEMDEAQAIIDAYFKKFPKVQEMVKESHNTARETGKVYSIFGRPRRLVGALDIKRMYGKLPHRDLPYDLQSLLNLAVNFRNQSAAASILNRAMIDFQKKVEQLELVNCNIILCVHDEIVVECMEEDAEYVSALLKDSMENTCSVPNVDMVAIPKVAKTLGGLK